MNARSDELIGITVVECISYCRDWNNPAADAMDFAAGLIKYRNWPRVLAERIVVEALDILLGPREPVNDVKQGA